LKKLQQFYIFKISTSRLKNSKYNLTLTIDDARKSGEIVSIGDSQVFRSLRQLKNISFSQEKIDNLLLEKRKIKRKKHSSENSETLLQIEDQIDSLLFVPEIISVSVSDLRHYEYLGQNGFYINGIKFIRLLCGAGQARRNNSLWVSEEYEEPLKKTLNNNRNSILISPAKFNAYFGLNASATLQVSTPYFCVVPDLKIKRTEKVDYIEEIENGDDVVIPCEKEIEFNLWDGQGLISPKFAKQWADDLGLNYIPSAFIIRANFIKGMVCVFDFHRFAEEIAEQHHVTDIWGNKYNLRDADIILTESQFKLWEAFSSLDHYVYNCKKNNLTWGVSRVTPKIETPYTFLNYQFVQVLDLDDDTIKKLCQPTLDFFSNIIKNKIEYTLLYLLGKLSNQKYNDINLNPNNLDNLNNLDNVFNKIQDAVTKALILNNELIHDPYIKNYLIHSLNKKIKESYIGNLLIHGFYTMAVSDPYAFMENLFNLPLKGLLNRDEHYNRYWLDQKENKLVAMRAPLTWKSEINPINLKENSKIKEWYKYLNNCIVYNVFGNDCLYQSGSDFDGDIVCITNNTEIITNLPGGLPIYYDSKKSPKQEIIEEELYKADLNGFNNRVGFVTNVATTAFAMLPNFEKDSPEYTELINRLKCFRKEQGSTIDATKGLIIKPFPIHWTRWKKISEEMEDAERENLEFLNRIVINKRPYFMRWVYSHYNRNYIKFKKAYSKDSHMRFNKEINEVLENAGITTDVEECKFIFEHQRYNPLLETNCLMNKIAWYMEEQFKQLKISTSIPITDENIQILKDSSIPFDEEKYKKLDALYRIYKKEKRKFSNAYAGGNTTQTDVAAYFKTIDQFNKFIRQKAYEISSNGAELVNLVVDICYVAFPGDNKSFLWQIFSNEIIENIAKNKQEKCFIPALDDNGNINYLYSSYLMTEIKVMKNDSDHNYNLDNEDDYYFYENIE